MKINYSFIFLIILSLYIGYFNNLLLFILAFLIHELGHIVIIKLFRIKIKKFTMSLYGGLLELDEYSYKSLKLINKILLYINGIVFNLIFYIIFKNSLFGKYNLILCIFNLVPIYPLDGFNILKVFSKKHILNNLSVIFIVLLLIISIYNNSLGLLIITIILIIKNIKYYYNKDKIYLLKLINNMI